MIVRDSGDNKLIHFDQTGAKHWVVKVTEDLELDTCVYQTNLICFGADSSSNAKIQMITFDVSTSSHSTVPSSIQAIEIGANKRHTIYNAFVQTKIYLTVSKQGTDYLFEVDVSGDSWKVFEVELWTS